MIRFPFAAVAALALPLLAFAQADTKPPGAPPEVKQGEPKGTDPKPPEFELRFVDNSVLFVSVADSTLEVNTKYGKLTVPLAEVRKVELGFHYPSGVEAEVKGLVADLGSADFKTRDAAQKRLVAIGEWAVPGVRAALKSGTPEVVQRADAIMRSLEQKLTKEKLEVRDFDTIITEEMAIRGQLLSAGFKAKSKYFGDVSVKMVDLKELRPVGSTADGRFTLDAARYATQGWKGWLDTGIEASKDSPLEIAASGQIDQWSQEPGKYVSGPNGTGAQVVGPVGAVLDGGGLAPLGGGGFPGGAGGPAGGFGAGGGFPGGGMTFSSGCVYARIGEKGAVFKVGEKYLAAKAPAAGKVYLIIAPSNWGNESTGEYAVTVKTGG